MLAPHVSRSLRYSCVCSVCVSVCVVPNVEEDQLSGAIHVGFIGQLLEEAGEFGSKEPAALAHNTSKEEQQDAVLQTSRDLPFRVQLVLVCVVLQQDSVDEQIHHDGGEDRRKTRPV